MTPEQEAGKAFDDLRDALLAAQKAAEKLDEMTGGVGIGLDGHGWGEIAGDCKAWLNCDGRRAWRQLKEDLDREARFERDAIAESDAEQRREWAEE